MRDYSLEPLISVLTQPMLDFAVLEGSRATGTANDISDWYIALQSAPQQDLLTVLGEIFTANLARAGRFLLGQAACSLAHTTSA